MAHLHHRQPIHPDLYEAWVQRAQKAEAKSETDAKVIAALREALRLFVEHCTYPVSTEINPRGYAWRSEESLDYARGAAEAALAAAYEQTAWNSNGK